MVMQAAPSFWGSLVFDGINERDAKTGTDSCRPSHTKAQSRRRNQLRQPPEHPTGPVPRAVEAHR
jgi:hypothetical protein